MLTPRPWTSSPQSRETRLRFCLFMPPSLWSCSEAQARSHRVRRRPPCVAARAITKRRGRPMTGCLLSCIKSYWHAKHSCALSGGFRATPPELSSWENGRPAGARRATPAFHRPARTCDGGAGTQLRHLPGGKHITCYCQVISPFWETEGRSRPQGGGPWAPTRKPRTRLQLSALTQPLRSSVCGTVALTASG